MVILVFITYHQIVIQLYLKNKTTIEKFYVKYISYFLDVDLIPNNTRHLTTVPMTQNVGEGKIRIVLMWPDGPLDLDLHSSFKISKFTKCEIYFGKDECLGTELNTYDRPVNKRGVDVITINTLGNYIYTFAVHKYVDVSNGVAKGDTTVSGAADNNTFNKETTKYDSSVQDHPISDSRAKISVYVNGFKDAIYKLELPLESTDNNIDTPNDTDPYNWWIAFCLNGNIGVNSITPINKLATTQPTFNYCENLYEMKPSFTQLSTNYLGKLRN
jgi:hypothetical protein